MNFTNFSLILGWWAARWFVHLGVWQYLKEHKLRPAEIVGTSMWSIIGACMAVWLTLEETLAICKEWNTKKLTYLDMYPKNGLLAGKKILQVFRDTFGATTKIEDCQTPLKIIATDIDTGQVIVFATGNLTDAVRASMSIPGIFEPHLLDTTKYIDGGIICNLGVEHAAHTHCLAVSALAGVETINRDIPKKYNIWPAKRFAGRRLLVKTLLIMAQTNEQKSLLTPDKKITLIAPRMDTYRGYEFEKYEELQKLGYETICNSRFANLSCWAE